MSVTFTASNGVTIESFEDEGAGVVVRSDGMLPGGLNLLQDEALALREFFQSAVQTLTLLPGESALVANDVGGFAEYKTST